MRILLGAVRGLVFFSLASAAAIVSSACDQLSAGQSLWVRLTSPISTYTAKVDDPVHAVLTQDLVCGREVLVPMGTRVDGIVRAKRKVGWGIRHETAALQLEFNQLNLSDGSTLQMSARVEEVENSREQVKNGVIHGVMSTDTFQGRINSRLIHLPTWNPYSDMGLIIYKATFPIFPEPEIYYPSGTDLHLKTKAPISSLPEPMQIVQENDPLDVLLTYGWVQQLPRRTTTLKSVDADLVNLVFIGSKGQVESAFREAGWHNSDHSSRHTFEKNFYALLNNSGYQQQPMTTQLIEGKPEDMNWQKNLNSYARRDHLRIWEWLPEGGTDPVWVGASTHDTGAYLSVKSKGFLHHISSDIDNEREKVIRDLNFSGCIKSLAYVSRPGLTTMTQNANGDVMRTDASIAVVQLQDCNPVAPEVPSGPSSASFKPGNHVFRYIRREILTFRNDIWRANVFYGAYDLGRMAVAAVRHQPLPPINEDPKPALTLLPLSNSAGVN